MIHLTNTHTLVAIKSQIAIPTILYCPKKVINSCIIMVEIIKIKTNICQIIIFLKYFSRRITLEIKQNMGKYIRIHFIYIIKKMNFSFELSWALLTWNINEGAMMEMGTVAAALLGGIATVRAVVILGLAALTIISRWKVFSKAWLPGRGIFIPFYNRYLMFKLGGRSGRTFLWILIPPVFAVLMIINYFNIAKNFWKHWTYGIGITLLKIIFIPILAFDDSTYLGKKIGTKKIAKPTTITTTQTITKAPIKKAVAKKIIKKSPAKKTTTPAPKKKVVTKKK